MHKPRLGQKILNALQDIDIDTHSEYTTKSRSYKLGVAHDNMEASIQGSVIFDPSSQLPREALLESTLKAFGFSMDIWEVGSTMHHGNQYFNTSKAHLIGFFVVIC